MLRCLYGQCNEIQIPKRSLKYRAAKLDSEVDVADFRGIKWNIYSARG